jgi:hypothetical protein
MVLNSFRILYVGRKNAISDHLQTLFEQPNPIPVNGHRVPVVFTALTNQKSALRLMGTQPPAALWVETDHRSESRLRF